MCVMVEQRPRTVTNLCKCSETAATEKDPESTLSTLPTIRPSSRSVTSQPARGWAGTPWMQRSTFDADSRANVAGGSTDSWLETTDEVLLSVDRERDIILHAASWFRGPI